MSRARAVVVLAALAAGCVNDSPAGLVTLDTHVDIPLEFREMDPLTADLQVNLTTDPSSSPTTITTDANGDFNTLINLQVSEWGADLIAWATDTQGLQSIVDYYFVTLP